MNGHRQAAVALHGISLADRALILRDLPAADQQILRGYLAELDELGFDSSEAMPLLRGAADDSLASASAGEMAALLQGEPAALVAQFLSIEPWRWRGEYLALQSPARRDALRAAAPDTTVAPARAHFLLNAIRDRLQRQEVALEAQLPRSTSAWRKRLLTWTR
jgi:hypothetical protein